MLRRNLLDLRHRRPGRAVHRHQAHRPRSCSSSLGSGDRRCPLDFSRRSPAYAAAVRRPARADASILGVVYPLAVTAVGQVVFQVEANGSVITVDGRTVGSSLIGQSFADADGDASRSGSSRVRQPPATATTRRRAGAPTSDRTTSTCSGGRRTPCCRCGTRRRRPGERPSRRADRFGLAGSTRTSVRRTPSEQVARVAKAADLEPGDGPCARGRPRTGPGAGIPRRRSGERRGPQSRPRPADVILRDAWLGTACRSCISQGGRGSGRAPP